MNKNIIILTFAGLLWGFGLGLFLHKSNDTATFAVSKTTLPAGVVLSQEKQATEKTVMASTTILIFGDMMLDRQVRAQINKNGQEYPFALIKDFLQGNDIVVANAEGPFTYNKSLTLGVKDGPLVFTFSPTILPTLKNLGFTLLNQANNHTLNFGTAGFHKSTSLIEVAGLNWFGDPSNKIIKPYIAEIRGQKIAFIGYNEFAYQGLNNVLQAIKNDEATATPSFVVVYAHWGEEYKLNFNSAEQKTAHAFIDAGADAVIGAHPHVTQPVEMYNGKPIFYSLGNFIFDQAANAPTGRGLAVKIYLTQDSATYNLFPISILKQQAALMALEARQKELDRLNVPTGQIVVSR